MLNKLILASKSPQRKRILKDMGIEFKAVPSHIDETKAANGLKAYHSIAKRIAYKKAEEIANRHPDEWILGCDTFVVLSDGSLSIKPKNRSDARKTINLYRNSHCDVYSGLALINKNLNKKFVHYDRTRLYFRNFSNKDIEQYLCSGEWKERSGSMTIEGRGGKWVKKIEGDYWNVVGLPVDLLKKFLNQIKK
jgi:septum formation protein